MPGILFFADLFASWIDALSEMWAFLQNDMTSLLNDLISNTTPGGPLNIGANLLKGLLVDFGLFDNTLLEVIIAVMGTGFAFFAVFSLIKWGLDVIT